MQCNLCFLVYLEIVSPLEVISVHFVLVYQIILVPVSQKPRVLAALKPSVVGFHVTSLVWDISASSISMTPHVRPENSCLLGSSVKNILFHFSIQSKLEIEMI